MLKSKILLSHKKCSYSLLTSSIFNDILEVNLKKGGKGMDLINALTKFVSQFLNSKEKEVSKMKKIMIVGIVALLAIGINASTGYAYSHLGTGSFVTISASGTLAGTVASMDATAVDQGTADANPGLTSNFTSPSSTGVANSNRAIRVSCGTNHVNSRIIIYTDNASYFPTKKQGVDPRFSYSPTDATVVTGPSGVDGAGLVGQSVSGYVAAMVFGISDNPGSTATAYSAWGFDPTANPALTKATYLVDKSHFTSFTTQSSNTTSMDSKPMYAPVGNSGGINPITFVSGVLSTSTNLNTANDGLYPQYWDFDMYDTPNVNPASPGTALVVSEALYKNIATVAFSFGPGNSTYPNNYICTVSKSSGTQATIPMALLPSATGTVKYLYIDMGALFYGLPAQTYATTKLNVDFVEN